MIGKCAKQCMHCTQNTLLPYEYDWTFIACDDNDLSEKMNLQKNKEKIKFYQSVGICRRKYICILYKRIYKIRGR